MATTAIMSSHVDEPVRQVVQPRVVISSLGPGESAITGAAPSLKVLLEGEETYSVDGRMHRVSAGSFLFVDRGSNLEAQIRGRTRGMCIYLPTVFDGSSAREELELLGRTSLQAASSRTSAALLALASDAHRSPDTLAQRADEIVRLASATLIGTVHDAHEQMKRLETKKLSTRREVYHRLETARAFLHSQMTRIVSLAEVSRVAGLSSFHLARYFTAVYGVSPVRYHRSLRLQFAATLMRAQNHSATDAADAIGYGELPAFTHAFRREFGYPPSAIDRSLLPPDQSKVLGDPAKLCP